MYPIYVEYIQTLVCKVQEYYDYLKIYENITIIQQQLAISLHLVEVWSSST